MLWRSQDRKYMKRDSKEQAWTDVTENLNSRFGMASQREDIVAIYKNLKDYYARQKRKNAKMTGSEASRPKKPWKFEDSFVFMQQNKIAIDRPRLLMGSQESIETNDWESRPLLSMSSSSAEQWMTPTWPKRTRKTQGY
ncbi:hypothetical protein L596_013315 [Steinernema carpocapsae]|uniref:MADF domain-containing protein n=1 Tax=Steinernema carpocapsae TaxID=34508 RepID=A0A4V6A538_STECR|nr:hypothetical protein L596_013315 [Steinernema carpocapsae]